MMGKLVGVMKRDRKMEIEVLRVLGQITPLVDRVYLWVDNGTGLGYKTLYAFLFSFLIFLLDDHTTQHTRPSTTRSRTDYAFLLHSIPSLGTIFPPGLR